MAGGAMPQAAAAARAAKSSNPLASFEASIRQSPASGAA
jgi:hypothetical protein